MNKRRYRSLELMRGLQPAIQCGLVDAKSAKEIVDDYRNGSTEKLNDLVSDPNMPMQYIGIASNLKNFL